MREKVERILREKIRPFLALKGGGVELVEVTEDNIVRVKLSGACAGCPFAQITLTNMVEKTIKSEIPQIRKVEAVQS
ncbi:NifU family protein [Candidatus Aerophobetes bacterium]|nr:NifU family protein [Candidatus Aerophobetes bacterium]